MTCCLLETGSLHVAPCSHGPSMSQRVSDRTVFRFKPEYISLCVEATFCLSIIQPWTLGLPPPCRTVTEAPVVTGVQSFISTRCAALC